LPVAANFVLVRPYPCVPATVKTMKSQSDMSFQDAVRGFMAGDFSRLAPLFDTPSDGSPCPVIQWYEGGLFANEPQALAEAFTCACFNGCTHVVEYFLARGINPSGGINTGLNAFHWAANRGQLKIVEILIQNKTPLETLNMYHGTVLGCTVWSAVHEPKPDHVRIVEALLKAGAQVGGADIHQGTSGSMIFCRPLLLCIILLVEPAVLVAQQPAAKPSTAGADHEVAGPREGLLDGRRPAAGSRAERDWLLIGTGAD